MTATSDRLCRFLVDLFRCHDEAEIAIESSLEDDIARLFANPGGGFPGESDSQVATRDRWSELLETACDILALELNEWDACGVLAGIRYLSERSGETELRDALGSLTPSRRNRIEEQLRREMGRLGLELPAINEADHDEESAPPPARTSEPVDTHPPATTNGPTKIDDVGGTVDAVKWLIASNGLAYTTKRETISEANRRLLSLGKQITEHYFKKACKEDAFLARWKGIAEARRLEQHQASGTRDVNETDARRFIGGFDEESRLLEAVSPPSRPAEPLTSEEFDLLVEKAVSERRKSGATDSEIEQIYTLTKQYDTPEGRQHIAQILS